RSSPMGRLRGKISRFATLRKSVRGLSRFSEASRTGGLYPRAGSPATMTPVRFGLVGFGAWGSHHARAIAATPGAELVAIAARSAATCAAARTAYPAAHVYDDYRALLGREQIDVVDIVIPSHLHYEVATAVL